MIRYSRFVEPEVPLQRVAPRSPSPKPRTIDVPQVQSATEPAPTSLHTDMLLPAIGTLLAGVEQLELTAILEPRELRDGEGARVEQPSPSTPRADGRTG